MSLHESRYYGSEEIERPRWDEACGTLFLGDTVIKRFRRPAPTQKKILDVFEEEQWPQRIDDPLPPKQGSNAASCKWRFRSAVADLNRAQHDKTKIRFALDGTGQGVCWRISIE